MIQTLESEEQDLQQKAKSDWIQLGDSISAYFHDVLKKRKTSNAIRCIRKAGGSHVFTREVVKEVISFYQNLFSENSQEGDWTPIPRKILPKEVQHWLLQAFLGVRHIIKSSN